MIEHQITNSYGNYNNNAFIYYYLAYAYEQIKDYENAIWAVNKAIESYLLIPMALRTEGYLRQHRAAERNCSLNRLPARTANYLLPPSKKQAREIDLRRCHCSAKSAVFFNQHFTNRF